MLAISNLYGHGFDAHQLSRLERLGFRIRPKISTYMGSQVCRFIDFEQGPCLELIEVEDDQAYLDFIPAGMTPYCPGISLAISQESEIGLQDYEGEFQHLHPYALHVNYDGSTDPVGPGWNYLNFARPIVSDTFIWLTGYDQPRPKKAYVSNHPNMVKGILGIVFDLKVEGLQQFAQLVSKDLAKESFKIDNVAVWPKSSIEDVPDLRGKIFPLTAIVLQAETLDSFVTPGEGVRPVSFMARPALHIETNQRSWDILVTT